MHIPAYAYTTIRSALPGLPTARHVEMLDCCLCDKPFEDSTPIPLGPTPESGLFGCRSCLTRLVARARRTRDAALAQDAERAGTEAAAWAPVRERHLARLDRVRQAAEAVTALVPDEGVRPLRVAALLVSLESAYAWVPDAPEPPASMDQEDPALRDEKFRLDLAMVTARETVAERLAYHLINEAQPDEPEMCGEMECPADCSGRHDVSEIDCGPDAIFDDLTEHGIAVERPAPEPTSHLLTGLLGESGTGTEAGQAQQFLTGIHDVAPALLAPYGIDADDVEALTDAAAVGLVADAWREGPLEVIHAAEGGPTDGEIFAQSVDLYRRARTALVTARDDGPDALLGFVAVASDLDLPWAGGTAFTLRTMSGPAAEFVKHVDDRVWFTGEVIRHHDWRAALLHRAMSAAFKASDQFGMPGWQDAVAGAMERLAELDLSDAPGQLADLAAVETALREAPDRLGVDALDWMVRQGVFVRDTGTVDR
ncbi:hypothetical protein [Streptomyces sp. NPDC049879]|uniref:hypothetical protein n=1 Tax=Streptomyces sp. NPDC049879 TaxID=3365598 RepID=UPI003793C8C5